MAMSKQPHHPQVWRPVNSQGISRACGFMLVDELEGKFSHSICSWPCDDYQSGNLELYVKASTNSRTRPSVLSVSPSQVIRGECIEQLVISTGLCIEALAATCVYVDSMSRRAHRRVRPWLRASILFPIGLKSTCQHDFAWLVNLKV